MRLTQGQFSFLPDLTDEEINKQITYALSQGWAVAVESTDDPRRRQISITRRSVPPGDRLRTNCMTRRRRTMSCLAKAVPFLSQKIPGRSHISMVERVLGRNTRLN